MKNENMLSDSGAEELFQQQKVATCLVFQIM